MGLRALCTLHAILVMSVHAWCGVSAEAVHHSLQLRTRLHHHRSTRNDTDALEPQAGSLCWVPAGRTEGARASP